MKAPGPAARGAGRFCMDGFVSLKWSIRTFFSPKGAENVCLLHLSQGGGREERAAETASRYIGLAVQGASSPEPGSRTRSARVLESR